MRPLSEAELNHLKKIYAYYGMEFAFTDEFIFIGEYQRLFGFYYHDYPEYIHLIDKEFEKFRFADKFIEDFCQNA